MLLIRPFMQMNAGRLRPIHVVMFIFIVSNCGGLLTPLGDPPLFLGFLKGVPFEWTLFRLWREWLVVNAALIAVFYVWDHVVFVREEKVRPGSQLDEVKKHEPVGIELPVTVDLTVEDTSPGIKGATASAQVKPATLETGVVVQVPPFVNEGDKIRVNTETGEYQGRV